MATTRDGAHSGALVMCIFLTLFYKLAQPLLSWPDRRASRPRLRPLLLGSLDRQDLPKYSARRLVNPTGLILFASADFIGSPNFPNHPTQSPLLWTTEDAPPAQIMSFGPEGRLRGCAHAPGCCEPAGLSVQQWARHNALLFPPEGTGDAALAGPVCSIHFLPSQAL